MSHGCETVGVVGPKHPRDLFRQLDLPLDFLPHRVEHHDLAAIEQHQRTALPVELGVPLLLERELGHIHAEDLVAAEILLELDRAKTTLKKLKQARTWVFHQRMVPS